MQKIKIGVIREYKSPSDFRVPLPPKYCRELLDKFPQIDLTVERSPDRSYKNEEYEALNINLVDDISDRDILIGVKEVPKNRLIPNKIYFFFSHTHKKQVYNRALLQTIIKKNIRMVDYECLRYENGKRVIGFGRFAGIVGAHNGVQAYANRTGKFAIPPAFAMKDFQQIKEYYKRLDFPTFKTIVTGEGKVAHGALETLRAMGIKEVSPTEYLADNDNEAVFTHLCYKDFYERKSDGGFDKKEFYAQPELYICPFEKYYETTDLFINGIFWKNINPVYFTAEEMKKENFRISVIADVTCDISKPAAKKPTASIPSTLAATVIKDSVRGYDVHTKEFTYPYQAQTVDMMTIDNLPNELPRDASEDFGRNMVDLVIPELIKPEISSIIAGATLTRDGQLTEKYRYLQDFVEGK